MQNDVIPALEEFAALPKFPDGRINYSCAKKAAVLICAVQYEEKILLLKRSDKVANYPEKWNLIAGFIDQKCSLRKKVLEELAEEICITEKDIARVRIGCSFEQYDVAIQKTWVVYPVLVTLKHKPEIKLNWENSDYAWIQPTELPKYVFVTGLDEIIKKIIDIYSKSL